MLPGAIDYWCNLFTPEALRKMFMEIDELRTVVEWWGMQDRVKGHPVEEFIKLMDEAGVAKVGIPSIKMGSYQKKMILIDMPPEEVDEIVKQAPDRFFGLAGINPFKKMDGVREIERAVKELGFNGAHLHIYGFGLPINDKILYPFYAKCVELDIPVVMQIGHSAELMPSALAQPVLLDDLALDFPELRIVAAHTGWPWITELIAMAWKHPNVYIGTSAHAPKYWDQELVAYMKSRGRGKVLYGSDFPVLTHKDSMAQIEAMDLPDKVKEPLLWGAAEKVFKFKK